MFTVTIRLSMVQVKYVLTLFGEVYPLALLLTLKLSIVDDIRLAHPNAVCNAGLSRPVVIVRATTRYGCDYGL